MPTPPANSSRKPRPNDAMRGATRVFNPLMMLLAGTRLMPLYGVLRHVGRRSGRIFRTPVVVRPTGDGFIVPMPWGESTDWYRNVRAAGECVVRWKGRDYALARPEVIQSDAATAAFGPRQAAALKRFGINQCLRLRYSGA